MILFKNQKIVRPVIAPCVITPPAINPPVIESPAIASHAIASPVIASPAITSPAIVAPAPVMALPDLTYKNTKQTRHFPNFNVKLNTTSRYIWFGCDLGNTSAERVLATAPHK